MGYCRGNKLGLGRRSTTTFYVRICPTFVSQQYTRVHVFDLSCCLENCDFSVCAGEFECRLKLVAKTVVVEC